MNKQREIIYSYRKSVISSENLREEIASIAEELTTSYINIYTNEKVASEEWDWKGLNETFYRIFNSRLNIDTEKQKEIEFEELKEFLLNETRKVIDAKVSELGEPVFQYVSKVLLLQTIDLLWKDHLLNMDHLREGIGLRGYGQRDPLIEYKREAFEMFESMIYRIKEDTISKLMRVQIKAEEAIDRVIALRQARQRMNENRPTVGFGGTQSAVPVTRTVSGVKKVGRNDPCPCGSGKKYKKCCGKAA